MNNFADFKELRLEEGQVEGIHRIVTSGGRVIISGKFSSEDDAERIVACCNALRKIAYPMAHIPASEAYTNRLEQLRKEAWETAQALQIENDDLRRRLALVSA